MKVKGVTFEDFVNYKEPSMFIAMPECSFKCEKECGLRCCQNSELALAPSIEADEDSLIQRYLNNKITKSVCFGGLEPMDSFRDVLQFITLLRVKYRCLDTVVIYTGYDKSEIALQIEQLKWVGGNVIVKYGRFRPDQKPHYDEVLGVNLASDNQYAERII